MTPQAKIDYDRIAVAIQYLKTHFREQPNLDEVAAHVHLSPFHFQRLFSEWAGVSPKKFLQYLSVEYAKGILKAHKATLFDAALKTGLSGTGRLHDLFINIEGMTPNEYKQGGANLEINYSLGQSPFGEVIVAATNRGVCHLEFLETRENALANLQRQFPNARYTQQTDTFQQHALQFFHTDSSSLPELKLHLKGTEFQLKVWAALLRVPAGTVTTYGEIANAVQSPKAARAAGTAIGSNPVAYLVPCHRVIQGNGATGGYMWGPIRKAAILGWEAAHYAPEPTVA